MRYVLAFIIILSITIKCMSQHAAKWYGTTQRIHKDSIEVTLHVNVADGWWIYFPNKHFTISKKNKGKNVGVYNEGFTYVDRTASVKGFTAVMGGGIEMIGTYYVPKSIKDWVWIRYPYTLIDSTGHYTNYVIDFEMDTKKRVYNSIVDTFIALPSCRCGSEFDF